MLINYLYYLNQTIFAKMSRVKNWLEAKKKQKLINSKHSFYSIIILTSE